MFANKNGSLPTRDLNEYFTEDYYMNFPLENNKDQDFIIGVQLTDPKIQKTSEKFQFMISFTYDRKAMQINPGVL